MSAITDVKCVLSQKAFDDFCEKFHIPEEVHPVLPNQGDTMHERPAGKIGTSASTYPNYLLLGRPSKRSDKSLTTIGRIVLLLPVAPDRAESELKASVDKLFDEGGCGNQEGQRDFAGVREGANIQPVTEATDTVVEDVAPLQLRRQRKRKTIVVDVGKASHPPKKLREDHGTPSGVFIGGKSRSAVQWLLVGAVLNAEVRGEPIPTLPFVTSSIFATPGTNVAEAEVDSLIKSSAPVMTTVTIVTPTVDTAAAAKEKPVEPSLFGAASSSAGGTNPTPGGFSDLTSSDFIVGGIGTVISPDTNLQKVYVPQWGVTNGSRLEDGHVCREMVDEFAPPKFFASIRGMEHD
ncbi:hypothetical protein Tco_0357298 [Tanacetum coccineum]